MFEQCRRHSLLPYLPALEANVHRTLWRALLAGVLTASLSLAACQEGDTTDTDQTPGTSTSAPVAPETPGPTGPVPAANIPAKCKDLPLNALPVDSIQKILKTTVTNATHSEGTVTGGATMSSCYYTTSSARPGKIKPSEEDKRIVSVSVITGDSDDEYWDMILKQEKRSVSIGVGEASVANTDTDLPSVVFKLGAWIVGINFMDEAGTVDSHGLIKQLAQEFEKNAKNR